MSGGLLDEAVDLALESGDLDGAQLELRERRAVLLGERRELRREQLAPRLLCSNRECRLV